LLSNHAQIIFFMLKPKLLFWGGGGYIPDKENPNQDKKMFDAYGGQ